MCVAFASPDRRSTTSTRLNRIPSSPSTTRHTTTSTGATGGTLKTSSSPPRSTPPSFTRVVSGSPLSATMTCGSSSTARESLTLAAFTAPSLTRSTSTRTLTGSRVRCSRSTSSTPNGTAANQTFASTPTSALTGARAAFADLRKQHARIVCRRRTLPVARTCALTAQPKSVRSTSVKSPRKTIRPTRTWPLATALPLPCSAVAARVTTTSARLKSATGRASASRLEPHSAPSAATASWKTPRRAKSVTPPRVDRSLVTCTKRRRPRVARTAPTMSPRAS
mmetsp:Transcript_10494/g.33227  ORF Transcript_10494/g.33227 Transcript_10494/m.33227 type:complete len:280 (-) Transcript_10494:305-1144(-)